MPIGIYKYLMFSSIFLLLSFVIGCDPFAKTADDFYEKIASTDLTSESINKIAIGQTEERIINVFGKPEKLEKIDQPNVSHLSYQNEKLRFVLNEQRKIIEYFVADPTFQTVKGVKIGDKKKRIIEIYGEHYYEREEGGVTALGYFDKQNGIMIEFALKEGKLQFFLVRAHE